MDDWLGLGRGGAKDYSRHFIWLRAHADPGVFYLREVRKRLI